MEGLPPRERYVGLDDRFNQLPTSVWVTQPRASRFQNELRALVGDYGQSRTDTTFSGSDSLFGTDTPASIFNPELAGMIVQAYTQRGDYIVDPFAGGGTRAVISAALGRTYHGIDVREEEVLRVRARLAELGLHDKADIELGSSTRLTFWTHGPNYFVADALITCPPYWNLEVYSDDPEDLSTAPTYTEFLEKLRPVISNSFASLKPGALAVWVVGDIRHPKGELLDFPGDLTRLHQEEGFYFYDRVIYSQNATQGAAQRSGMFDKTRKVVRLHEYVMVFQRASGKRLPVVGSL